MFCPQVFEPNLSQQVFEPKLPRQVFEPKLPQQVFKPKQCNMHPFKINLLNC